MEDRTKQIFLVTFTLFALLVWVSSNEPGFYPGKVNDEYTDFMSKKVSKIVNQEKERIKNENLKFTGGLIKNGGKDKPDEVVPLRFPASTQDNYDNCGLCCLKNGGTICYSNKTYCRDGSTPTNECLEKGCDACANQSSEKL
jgi:hypothetical protein